VRTSRCVHPKVEEIKKQRIVGLVNQQKGKAAPLKPVLMGSENSTGGMTSIDNLEKRKSRQES